MSKEALVIIGGTFNPFTNAHREMAVTVRQLLPEADIMYVPSNMSFIARWKELPEGSVFAGENRVELIRQSVASIPDCYVTDVECTGQISGKTYDTVCYFEKEYRRIYLCIGSDKLEEIGKWFQAEELMEKVEIILFTRGTYIKNNSNTFVNRYKDKIKEIDFFYENVSSSRIRELFEQRKFEEIRELVPFPVYRYLFDWRQNERIQV